MNGILIACEVTKISSLVDGSLSVVINTPELAPSKVGEVYGLRKKACFVYFSETQVSTQEQTLINGLKPDFSTSNNKKEKSKSQQLRAVFFRMWEKDAEGYTDDNAFYEAKMDLLINHYKNTL